MAEKHLTTDDGMRFGFGFGLGITLWLVVWAVFCVTVWFFILSLR